MATFDCNGDGLPDVYLAGGSAPAGLYRNESPVGGALRFRRSPIRRPTSRASPAPIRSISTATARSTWRSCGTASPSCCAASATAGSSARTKPGRSTGASPDDGVQRDVGRSAGLPTLALGRYLRLDPSGEPTTTCADDELIRPDPTGTRLRPTRHPHPRLLHPVDVVQRLGSIGSTRPAGEQRSPLLQPNTGGEQLWRIAPGQVPRLYTDADGWIPVQVEGMGIGSYDLTDDGYPDVFLTSQADEPTPDPDQRPEPAHLPRHRPQARCECHPSVHR